MGAHLSGIETADPVPRIVFWTVLVGGISFAAGFIGPILFSTSNLGPLLGIFGTGPLGALAGALFGALRVAKDSSRLSIACIGAVWAMTLLYTLLLFFFFGILLTLAIALQILILASSIFVLSRRNVRTQLPDFLQRAGPIAVVTQAIVLVTTLFPPVLKPWWVPAAQQQETDAPLPAFAFVYDERFDASRYFPLFAVNREKLAWEWIIMVVVAVGLCALIWALRRRKAV
jgi:hypothetical protein